MTGQPGGTLEVSVVIPAHNDETRLPRAIRSVLAQTHPVSEIIVVDDGSVDGTAAVAATFRKTICVRQKNSGAAGARNAGIARARSEWIAFLDSDDEWRPDHIKNAWLLLQTRPELVWYYCPFEKRTESGRFLSVLRLKGAVPPDRVASLGDIEREYGDLLPRRWRLLSNLLRNPLPLRVLLALNAIRWKVRKKIL